MRSTLKALLGLALLAVVAVTTTACSEGLTGPSGASVTTEPSPVTKVAGGNTATGVELVGVTISSTLKCATPSDPAGAPVVYLSSGDSYVLTAIWDDGQTSFDAGDGNSTINLPKGKTVRVVPSVRVRGGTNEYTSPAPFDFVVTDGLKFDLLFRRPCGGGQVPVSCVTTTPNVLVGETARFSAKDGDVSQPFNWSTPDGAPASWNGATFSTSFATSGEKIITVTNAGTTATCAVKVAVKDIPPSCSATSSSLTKGADTLSATSLNTSITASFAGSGAMGVLKIDGVATAFTSGTTIPLSYTRPEPGQSDRNVTLTLSTSVNSAQCETKTVTVVVPAKPAPTCTVNLGLSWIPPDYEDPTKAGISALVSVSPADTKQVSVPITVDGVSRTTLVGTPGNAMNMPFTADNSAHTIAGSVNYQHSNGATCVGQATISVGQACIIETKADNSGLVTVTNTGMGICYGGGVHIPTVIEEATATVTTKILVYGNGNQNKYHTESYCRDGGCEVPVGDLKRGETAKVQFTTNKTTGIKVSATSENFDYRYIYPFIRFVLSPR